METINEDGTVVLIEAVYYRYGGVYAKVCDTLEEAKVFLDDGEDYGNLSSVGVFVDGKFNPICQNPFLTDEGARQEYAKLPKRPKELEE